MLFFTTSTDLGSYSLVSGSFNGSGSSYFSGLVGKGYTATTTNTNYYSGSSGAITVFRYLTNINLPSNAEVTDCYVMVNGHAESTSNTNEYMCVQLFAADGTALTSELNFKSKATTNSTQTIYATVLPTVDQCSGMYIQCRLGWYGGAINGATVFVEYSIPTPPFRVKRYGSWVVPIKTLVKHEDRWHDVSKTLIKIGDIWQ